MNAKFLIKAKDGISGVHFEWIKLFTINYVEVKQNPQD